MVDDREPAPAEGETITAMVVVALRRIIRAIDLRSKDLVTHHGVTGPQLILLRELSAHDGASAGRLTRAIHLSQATVTGILDRLGKRGLVVRRRSEQDKRRVEVWLTDEGRRLVAEAPPLLQEQFTRQFGKLEDWEQTQILSALQRVVAMMEARDIDATAMLTTGPVDATPERTEAFLHLGSSGGAPAGLADADAEAALAADDDVPAAR